MSGQASIEEAREELGYMRADVLRVAAGIMANPNLGAVLGDRMRGRDVQDNAVSADIVAETALAVVRAVDRVCGVGS